MIVLTYFVRVSVHLEYDAAAMARIRKGFLPSDMREKWFVWFEEPILHLHKSWTGFCIYEIHFISSGTGARAKFAWVNRDPEQYTCCKDSVERSLISDLIDTLFAHSSAEETCHT
jgi:hypothetical protein